MVYAKNGIRTDYTMSKKLKTSYLALLSILLVLSVCFGLFIVNTSPASAEEDYSNDYSFENGCRIGSLYDIHAPEDYELALAFGVNLNNVHHRNVASMGLARVKHNLFTEGDADTIALYTFTLYRDNGDARASTPVSALAILVRRFDGNKFYRIVASKSYVSSEPRIYIFNDLFDSAPDYALSDQTKLSFECLYNIL